MAQPTPPWPLALAAPLVWVACQGSPSSQGRSTAQRPAQGAAQATSSAKAPSDKLKKAHVPAPSTGARSWPRRRWAQWVEELSEPDGPFISDNFVSNETSFLQPSHELHALGTGGVYLGVGPEQNFSYIALARPSLAIVVDLRRDNLLLHLLYKACFERAANRQQFLEMLLARPVTTQQLASPRKKLSNIVEALASTHAPTPASFVRRHGLLKRHIAGYPLDLTTQDFRRLKQIHQRFARDGLQLRFQLKRNSSRRYPSLAQLLVQRSPKGTFGSFLATREAFGALQALQRQNRIIPIVGNFAGSRALPLLATRLKARGLQLRLFYVSNVEQYLLAGGLWPRYRRNLLALPFSKHARFIRAYLDQGAPHPRQMQGHRTATLLQPVQPVLLRNTPYRNALELSQEGLPPP